MSDFATIRIDTTSGSERAPVAPFALTILDDNSATEVLTTLGAQAALTKATQEQAEAGVENTTYMTPLRTAEAIAALGGSGSTISTPQVYYVESDGNDGTAEVGNPAKPYLTAQAAYDDGKLAADPFMIQLGVGSFNIIDTTGITLDLISVNGRGCFDASRYLTELTISSQPVDAAANTNGANSSPIAIELNNMKASVNASGQSIADVNDANTYTAGNAAPVTVTGNARVAAYARGGSGTTTVGTITGGAGGNITLTGCSVTLCSNAHGDDSTDGTPTPAAGTGVIQLNNCNAVDATFGSIAPTSSIVGNTSYSGANLTPTDDKGGNSVW